MLTGFSFYSLLPVLRWKIMHVSLLISVPGWSGLVVVSVFSKCPDYLKSNLSACCLNNNGKKNCQTCHEVLHIIQDV